MCSGALIFHWNHIKILMALFDKGKSQMSSFKSNENVDLKGPKIKYELHYGWCTRRRFTAAKLHNTSCSEGK